MYESTDRWSGRPQCETRGLLVDTAQRRVLNFFQIFPDRPILLTFFASVIGGSCVAITMQPFDVLATRLYNQREYTKQEIRKSATLNARFIEGTIAFNLQRTTFTQNSNTNFRRRRRFRSTKYSKVYLLFDHYSMKYHFLSRSLDSGHVSR